MDFVLFNMFSKIIMEYQDALRIAYEFKNKFKDLKLEIVGSLERKDDIINDIDFITLEDLPDDKKYISLNYKGAHIDIWKVKNKRIGRFVRTVDKGHLIAIHKGLAKNGYRLQSDGIYDMNNDKLIPFNMINVWKLAGLPYRKIY